MCLGIPGQIVDLTDVSQHKALVEVSGVRRAIHVGLLLDGDGPGQGLEVGDWVLVHVGFAMSKMDAEEAERTLTFMRELGEYFDEEISQFRESSPL
ncbi:MAG: HypC/HybG/HupF family hydrogenase formation chaperone [Actinomycetota bacterium]|nr:HypC/HybG/HupF family hydrogenase formation chaperone [Actinomycetota bacterium]